MGIGERLFAGDGISGAECERPPAFMRVVGMLKRVDVLVPLRPLFTRLVGLTWLLLVAWFSWTDGW